MKHPMPADPGFRRRGHDSFALMPADAAVLTIEFKVNLLAPARGPWLRCEGLVVKAGRTISGCEGKAWQHQAGGPETLCATTTATLMTVLGRGLSDGPLFWRRRP